MTTAHKPTFHPAQGSDFRGGTLRGVDSVAVSSRDAPGQTKLHYRQTGQKGPHEPKDRDTMLKELEDKEHQHHFDKRKEKDPLLIQDSKKEEPEDMDKDDDGSSVSEEVKEKENKKKKKS